MEIAGLNRIIAARQEAENMIRVSVLYPNAEGKEFDMEPIIQVSDVKV
jgi:hypothetical protein